MPPLPRLTVEAIEDLAQQLRFAPRHALKRDLARTEQLASEIDPEQTYPEDFIIFRITGYRKQIDTPALITGQALLGELAALVEHLSAAAKIAIDEVPGALAPEEVCRRWQVSRKTLERYRKRGLISRRVVGESGRPRVVFPPEAVEAFEKRQPEILKSASSFTRLDDTTRERVIELARREALSGKSLNQAALCVSEQIGRGHETVRQILRKHDANSDDPIFEESGPLDDRQRRFAYRAWRRAIEPGEIADRLGKPRPAVQRVISDERASVLRSLLPAIRDGLDTAPDEIGIETKFATEGIGYGGPTGLADLLALARAVTVMPPAEERARAGAYVALRARAATKIEALPAHGVSAPDVDRIETDLRWAARIKAELVRHQLPTLLRTIEARLGHEAEAVGASKLRAIMGALMRSACVSIDRHHPSTGGRLAAPVSLAADRAMREIMQRLLIKPKSSTLPGRARRVIGSTERVADFTMRICPWQREIEPDARLRAGIEHLSDEHAELLRLRFGFAPTPAGAPLTLAELADRLDSRPLHVARSERAAIRNAIAAVRRGDTMNP
ncbi:MAG TPA: hypothetical protein ENJ00_11750 [Phycisphaerales bacterium]|nr:hypothetical protein [Phycisphaerales bacterium]